MVKESRLEEITSLIIEAQTFASESLGMYYPKPLSITQAKEDILYELYVSPKLELFYDYSEMEEASGPNKREIYRLEKDFKREGYYDTMVTNLYAYENDGIFLTGQVLKDTNIKIVGTVFHELTHSKLDLDISLEESIASVVDSLATISFYEQKEGKLSKNYEKAVIEDNLLKTNDDIIVQYYNMLYDVYKQEISDKEKLKIKKELCKEAESKLTYDHKINNASLTYYMTYSRYTNEVREVCKYSNSLKDAIDMFKSLNGRAWAYMFIQEFISTHKKE